MSHARRNILVRLVKLCSLLVVAGFLVVVFASIWPTATTQRVSMYVDTSDLEPGDHLFTQIGNLAVLVVRRSAAQLASLDDARVNDDSGWFSGDPDGIDPQHRGVEPHYLVVEAVGTALQCAVDVLPASDELFQGAPWPGGIADKCRGYRYDWAGRVYRDQPALRNLRVLPHAVNANDELTVSLP